MEANQRPGVQKKDMRAIEFQARGQGYLGPGARRDPLGEKWRLSELARLAEGFTAEDLARAVTWYRMQRLARAFLVGRAISSPWLF